MSSDLTPRTPYPAGMSEEFARIRGSATGRRLFLLGSGPSAAEIDLERLRGELTVSVNHFGLHPRVDAIAPTYHVVADPKAFDQGMPLFFEETLHTLSFLDRNPTRLVIPFDFAGQVLDHPRYLAWKPLYWRYGGEPAHGVDFSRPVPTYGQNVLNICLMFALHLGASEVYLIGFDQAGVVSRFGMTPHFYQQREISKAAEAYYTDEDLERCMYNHLRQLHSLRRMADEAGMAIFSCARKGTFRMLPIVDFEEIPGIPPSSDSSRTPDAAGAAETRRDRLVPGTPVPGGADVRALRVARKRMEEGFPVDRPGIDALLESSLRRVGEPRGGLDGAEALARVVPLWAEILETGRLKEIGATVSAWLELHPEHVDLRLLAARCAFLEGRPTEAEAQLDALRGVWPWSADAEVLSAEIALTEGDFAASLRHVKEAIERDNDAPRLFATVRTLERTVLSGGAGASRQATSSSVPGQASPGTSGSGKTHLPEPRSKSPSLVGQEGISEDLRASADSFRALRGGAKGRRVFLIGTGRSSDAIDLSLAKEDLAITVDGFGSHERISRLAPKHHIVADPHMWEACAPEERELHLRGLEALRASGAGILMPSSALQGPSGTRYRDLHPLLFRVGPTSTASDFSSEVAPWCRNPLNAGLMFCLHLMAQDVVLVGFEDDLGVTDPADPGRGRPALGQKSSMDDPDRRYGLLREQAILHRECLRAGMSISIASPSPAFRRYPHVSYPSLFAGAAMEGRAAAAQGVRPC